MLQPKPLPSPSSAALHAVAGGVSLPLFGALNPVLVDDSGEFSFDGAIRRGEAQSVWSWLRRDVAPGLIEPAMTAEAPLRALMAILPDVLTRARTMHAAATPDTDAERRLGVQLGGSEIRQRLPTILTAIKCAPLLDRATAFGRTINNIEDDHALIPALQSMPRQDAGIAAVLMMAASAQVAQPGRLIVAATRIAGDASETMLIRAGFAPLIDALLAQAQNTIPPLLQAGSFADIDLICRAVERFHRLIRAISANVEPTRLSRWASTIAALTKTVSNKLEPRLRDLVPNVNASLRRPREGADRLDSDLQLSALNGMYLMATIRDCRDSLALNELFDETWLRTGQTLEMHVTRAMDALREVPADPVALARLDAGIKMTEIRFDLAYADVLRAARDGIERHVAPLH